MTKKTEVRIELIRFEDANALRSEVTSKMDIHTERIDDSGITHTSNRTVKLDMIPQAMLHAWVNAAEIQDEESARAETTRRNL